MAAKTILQHGGAKCFGALRCTLAIAALFWLLEPACAEEWKFDVVHLRNGNAFDGLIVEESKEAVVFKHVLRKPGARTFVLDVTFGRDEISRIDKLSDVERRDLAERVALLDRGGEKERARIRSVRLQPCPWPTNGPARLYEGKHFNLASNVREDILRMHCVRLEDMFQAYVDRFGARREPTRPIQIVLCRSVAEYQTRLRAAGLNILNPACYDPQKNLILAATELEQRTDELDKLRQKHEGLLQELDAQEKKLRRHYNGRPPREAIDELRQTRRTIQLLSAENETAFERLKQPLFTILAHEAFHAYIESFVYPIGEGGIPHWLNEGLAQMCETAVIDGGELQYGRVDPKRLAALQDAIRQKQVLRLVDLLASEPRQFQLAHQSEALVTDRLFLASWGLGYYLTFDRKLLGTESMNRWLGSLHRGTNRAEAFRDLVGQPLEPFEAQFHKYIMSLRPDGSMRGN